jgi:DNA-binding protein H-NS
MSSAKKKELSELGNLAVDDLLHLRDRIERLIGQRISAEKLELRKKLARIAQYERRAPASALTPGATRRGRTIAPKYMEPTSGATWSGRGKVSRWMTRLIAEGAKREDFLIRETEADN